MPVVAPECYQAFLGKDVRFDGRFVAGSWTGVWPVARPRAIEMMVSIEPSGDPICRR
jgi:hypothetical protein